MKLLTYAVGERMRLGIVTPQGVLDVTAASEAFPSPDGAIPQTIMATIEGGTEAVAKLRELESRAMAASASSSFLLEETGLSLQPCVTHPNKIVCVGLNYRRHAEETNAPIPEYPILFNKFNNTLTGHGQDVVLPNVSSKVDYEAELAIVIGKTTKNVAKEEALNYVFGYCCANDLSARDLQGRTAQWMLGKTCDGFAPLGPYLVTADEAGNPNDLDIRSFVNGEPRQNSNTSDMIFACDEIVSYISRHMTLVAGDVILTGTPEGVILGYPKEKRVWLQDGDLVDIKIEKLGTLTNRMIADKGVPLEQ
ncbi:fumarylacetoacetate hydrolase family protein [Cohnella herbarum]|uniref:Fumarylacetoacetate hydrolase family protein n=1 Tax=Cohnella herbarum TaxID=2728023 RepID=A0A7Z2VNI5_9BACL|nr:fumarylacetoacetate hydrolase family protein [Cohnella herbarum]QJD86367.1 fumarylacetoacetate hydrolase family protein [Cohnella herbarum]